MEALTAQSIFETTWQRYVVENAPVSRRNGNAAYRGDGGASCPIGYLSTDEEVMSWEFLGGSTHVTELARFMLLPERLRPHVRLLGALQDTHDGWIPLPRRRGQPDTPERRATSLRAVAKRFGLTVPGDGEVACAAG